MLFLTHSYFMTKSNLFSLNSLDSNIRSALNNSLLDFKTKEDIDFWAQTSLKRNAEKALSNISLKNNSNSANRNYTSNIDPPGNGVNGFRALFGIQLIIGYKVRFKATANIGYGQRWGNFGATSSLHFAAYNGGLGTGINKNNLVVDITAAANLTFGGGQGIPLQSNSLNYNSPIPNKNNFKNSLSYGQLATWNSNINKNQFSFNDIQREGMIGFRLGDINVSSSNDTRRLYFGDGGDKAWTGAISISTPIFEAGFQDFSGDYIHDAPEEAKRDKLSNEIRLLKRNSSLSKEEKKQKIALLEKEMKELTYSKYHNQTAYNKNLNKASTYFRINKNGANATIDLIGDAWLQNGIHRAISDFRFEYEQKKVEVWAGKSF